MDVTSYLLGKQQGGGSTPTLQNKSVTITENGTTNVTADTGYDGLSQVEVTTNVSSGGEYTIAITPTTASGINRINTMITKISPDLDVSQMINMSYFFEGCTSLTKIPQLNTSGVKSVNYMFSNCTNLTTIPILDFSNVTIVESVFQNCPSFTDETLDNILVSLASTKPTVSYYKKLSQQGFNSTNYPAERIQALPHYQDFLDAGWTIGY